MRTLLLLMTAASSGLYGATITSVTCEMVNTSPVGVTDPTSSSCALQDANARASAIESLSGDAARLDLRAETRVFVRSLDAIPHAGAQSRVDSTFVSSGPDRSGFVRFIVDTFELHEVASNSPVLLITDGTHNYRFTAFTGPVPPASSCDDGCPYVGTLPFELGAPFQVSVAATADNLVCTSVASPFYCEDVSSQMTVNFSLLEDDGRTPVAFAAVPEPSVPPFVAFGLTGVLLSRLMPRRRSTSQR